MNTQRGNVIDGIIHAAFKHKVIVIILVGLSLALGVTAYQQMPRNVYPDITIPVFTITTEHEAMAPEEIESMITRPMESAMNGLPNVRRVRSQTLQGVSNVVVEFDLDIEFWRARQFVTERMAQVGSQFPSGTEAPMLSSATTRLAEVYEFAIEGDLPLTELREIAEWQVRHNLLTVPGVSEVLNRGGYLRQYRVNIDPNKMVALNVSLAQVEEAIKSGNENSAGGFISAGSTEYTVRGIGRFDSLEDLRNTVIAERHGVPIFLRDVAEAEESTAIRRGIATRNGKEAVIAVVIKQPYADTIKVVEGVEKAMAEMRSTLPDGVRLTSYYDQTHLIENSLSSVLRAILVGGVLVILVLFVFLGHFRGTLIVAAMLPLSVLIAGFVMRRFGVGVNTMSLGGLAIAIGIMVDASIIMIDNIFHRLQQNRVNSGDKASREEVARVAAIEVGKPITFATLIIIAVFLPLFLMGGIEGLLFHPLAITVAAAMAVALLLSLTLTPILASRLLRMDEAGNANLPIGPKAESARLLEWIKRGYIPALDWAFQHAWLTRGIAIAITIPAFVGFLFVGRNFMPRLDEGAWSISTATPPETSLEENARISSQIEKLLLANPNVADVVGRYGRSERTLGCVTTVTAGEIVVNLKPRRQLTESPERILAGVRAQVERIPGVAAAFTQPLRCKINDSLEGTSAPLQVKLFGPDIETLAAKGTQVRSVMENVRGLTDIQLEQVSGVPQLRIEIDRESAARHGISVANISEVVRLAIGGEELTRIWEDQRSYGVFVRFADSYRGDLDAIGNIPVDTPSGARIPLSQVANLRLTEGPNVISREAMSRRVSIDASIHGRALSSVVADIKSGLKDVKLPEGYFVVFGGQYQNQQNAMKALIVATLMALAVVFMLLLLALGRISDALIIIATLPDAFVGGILAMLITGETLNVSSGVGFIALFGIAVQNGLVLLTQTRGLEAQGLPMEKAIRQASIGRLRPKLMTACCAASGILPIILSGGVGAEIEKPLAIVLIGGLVTSTLFTLLVLPTVYVLVENLKQRFRSAAA